MDLNFKNKIVLITGGTRGIGKSIAKMFKENGAYVIITGTKDISVDGYEYVQVNFNNEESIKKFCKKILSYDRIDICINNAGINTIKSVDDVSFEDFNKINNVNIKAPYFVSQSVIELMKKNGYGRIINISSIWSVITKRDRSLYTSCKNALVGLTKTLSVEFAKYNILVNSVSPGFTKTELTNFSLSKKELEILKKEIPVGRLANTKEIASIVLFLSSDYNTYLTGQNLVVDGGFTII